jgi:hypothetical protein
MEGLTILKTTLTSRAASNIIQTAVDAGQHGIGYWARVVKIHQSPALRDPNVTGEPEMLNVAIVFDDMEGREPLKPGDPDGAAYTKPRRCKVHATDIGKAVTKILRDPVGTGVGKQAGRILTEDYVDGPLADTIMQVACFGKSLTVRPY